MLPSCKFYIFLFPSCKYFSIQCFSAFIYKGLKFDCFIFLPSCLIIVLHLFMILFIICICLSIASLFFLECLFNDQYHPQLCHPPTMCVLKQDNVGPLEREINNADIKALKACLVSQFNDDGCNIGKPLAKQESVTFKLPLTFDT